MATNTKNRSDLKSYFVKNAIPTQGQFADLIDAQLNQADDGVFKLPGEPLGVVAPAESQQKRTLRLYSSYPAANPDWLFSLNPAQNPADPSTARPGFGITNSAGNTRLFIDANTGYLGVGTIKPEATLHVAGGLRLNIGEGLQFMGDNNYFGTDEDARILRMIGINGSGGAVDGGFAIEGYTPTDDIRKPLMTIRGSGKATFHGSLGLESPDFTYLDIHAKDPGKDAVIRLFDRYDPSASQQPSYWSIHNDDSEENRLDFRYNNSSKAFFEQNGRFTARDEVRALGGVRVDGDLAAHIDVDGAFYRYSGEVYITVDNHLYIRDTDNNIRAHFNTKNGVFEARGAYIKVTGAGGEGAYMGGDGAGNDVQIGSTNSGVTKLAAYNPSSGYMTLVAREFKLPSDARLKENIEPVTRGLDKLMKLRPVSFTWKDADPIEPRRRSLGLVAQEVREVLPEAVAEARQGMLAMDYNAVLAVAIEAIKEQQSQITELRNAVNKNHEQLDMLAAPGKSPDPRS